VCAARWPGCGRAAPKRGSHASRCPPSTSACSTARRATSSARRRARSAFSAAIPVIADVPLTSASPSLWPSGTGASPAAASASAPGSVRPAYAARPSPTSTSATWASGVRSPLAPTVPFSGTTGVTPRARQARSRSAVALPTPEWPRARLAARAAMSARVCAADSGAPTPEARW
jgi:hypothetical protein